MGKKSKFAMAMAGIGLCVSSAFMLGGCNWDKNKSTNEQIYAIYETAVDNGYTGTYQEWLDSIKGAKGDKGDNGQNGIDGREIEFNKSATHIQWRYKTVDNSDVWKDLVSFAELNGQRLLTDNESKTKAYDLFKSQLNSMRKGNYRVTYDYSDGRHIVESFGCHGFVIAGTNEEFDVYASMEYEYDGLMRRADDTEMRRGYSFNGFASLESAWTPNNFIAHSYLRNNETGKYVYYAGGGIVRSDLANFYADSDFGFRYANYIDNFKKENIISCQFNEDGDSVISFNFYKNNYFSSKTPYLNSNYLYDFYVNKDGLIQKCKVYKRDFLDENKKGDMFCEINYQKGKSEISSEMLDDLLDKEKEYYKDSNPNITSWSQVFRLENSNSN